MYLNDFSYKIFEMPSILLEFSMLKYQILCLFVSMLRSKRPAGIMASEAAFSILYTVLDLISYMPLLNSLRF